MNYTSTVEFESKVIPEAKFKLRKMSHGRRMELNSRAAQAITEINTIQRELAPLNQKLSEAAETAATEPCSCEGHEHVGTEKTCEHPECLCRQGRVDDETQNQIDELTAKYFDVMISKMFPHYLEWGIESVSGLDINGQPATAKSIISDGPEELVAELGWEIHRVTRMSSEENLGFK